MCVVCVQATRPSETKPAQPPPRDDAAFARGRDFLARHPSVDCHAHPGRFFMRGVSANDFTSAYAPMDPADSIADMRDGQVSAVFFATVADLPVLGFRDGGLRATRAFEPGEAAADHARQLGVIDALADRFDMRSGWSADDVTGAIAEGRLACFRSVEGGDFIEDQLDRIPAAAARGVRSITIIHYRTNQIGDTQTETPTHGGLTPLGRDTVRAMEAAGIIIDLSHATFETSRDVAAMASRPVMLSHSNVISPGAAHPRLVSPDHARLIADTGGVIGVVPAGFAQESFADYIDTILRMTDQLGIDHIAIGTDMDFTYRSVFPSYRDWPLLPGTLLARGLSEGEVAKIMGGNMMRLMA